MQRKQAYRRGRVLPILAAGAIGYLLGSAHPATPANTDAGSATGLVASRFPQAGVPQALRDAPISSAAGQPVAAASKPMVIGDPQLALFDPSPMVPAPAASHAVPSPASPPLPIAPAGHESDAAPAPAAASLAERAVAEPAVEAKRLHAVAEIARNAAAAAARRRGEHPGFMLDDAQIASIKARLHLTPDQARMWPAVESALRNIASTRAHEARERGGANAARIAAVDPNSAEVQGLKYAAIPLLMSFNVEQKDEVRNLAHVMGLDQLASQF